ncbi:MAG TPA: type II secretion system minor pseudopilin GspI [Gammaproteobacteria bacterium]|nr:type II secretion system minor pseudopilin GspI [Gammaproteobacteria bacterium]
MASTRNRQALLGFTLLEALVALAIVALGMMAVQAQLNRYVVSAAVTEEKTLASWVAANKLTELSVAGAWPELGRTDDDVELAQRRWRMVVEVSETPVDNLRRVDVTVYLAEDPEREVHSLAALLEPPPPPGYMPVRWLPAGAGG